jgi:Nickel responsive protein SCO4226-like
MTGRSFEPNVAIQQPGLNEPVPNTEAAMAKFMDVHSGFFGVTADQLQAAHDADLAIEKDEGVHFERAWLDPDAGKVFCLATGPSREAVMRIHERAGHPTPEVYELSIEV